MCALTLLLQHCDSWFLCESYNDGKTRDFFFIFYFFFEATRSTKQDQMREIVIQLTDQPGRMGTVRPRSDGLRHRHCRIGGSRPAVPLSPTTTRRLRPPSLLYRRPHSARVSRLEQLIAHFGPGSKLPPSLPVGGVAVAASCLLRALGAVAAAPCHRVAHTRREDTRGLHLHSGPTAPFLRRNVSATERETARARACFRTSRTRTRRRTYARRRFSVVSSSP